MTNHIEYPKALRYVHCGLMLLALTGCETVSLDPYGRAYRDFNLMEPTSLKQACEKATKFDKAPYLEFGTHPIYPIHSMFRSKQGKAAVHFRIGADGTVAINKSDSTADPAFADHAAIAMRDWKVRPAEFAGQPIAAVCILDFVYRLE